LAVVAPAQLRSGAGPKVDHWLVRTVAGLMIVIGTVQISAGSSTEALQQARRIGVGTALTLGTIDIVYAPRGRISKMYLVDALLEGAWILAWLSAAKKVH
jgi:hypothetical protein